MQRSRIAILLALVVSVTWAAHAFEAHRNPRRGFAGDAAPGLELPPPGGPRPLGVVVEFLDLDATQAETLETLLDERKAAVAPLLQQIRQLRGALDELLDDPDAAPAAVGQLVLQIRNRREEIRATEEELVEQLEPSLDETQLEKLERARHAADLRPVLRALEVVGLI